MEKYRSTFGSRSYDITSNDVYKTNEQFIADLFVCAGLVASRREFRENIHNLRFIKIDPYTFLLGRMKKGHLLSARFVDLE